MSRYTIQVLVLGMSLMLVNGGMVHDPANTSDAITFSVLSSDFSSTNHTTGVVSTTRLIVSVGNDTDAAPSNTSAPPLMPTFDVLANDSSVMGTTNISNSNLWTLDEFTKAPTQNVTLPPVSPSPAPSASSAHNETIATISSMPSAAPLPVPTPSLPSPSPSPASLSTPSGVPSLVPMASQVPVPSSTQPPVSLPTPSAVSPSKPSQTPTLVPVPSQLESLPPMDRVVPPIKCSAQEHRDLYKFYTKNEPLYRQCGQENGMNFPFDGFPPPEAFARMRDSPACRVILSAMVQLVPQDCDLQTMPVKSTAETILQWDAALPVPSEPELRSIIHRRRQEAQYSKTTEAVGVFDQRLHDALVRDRIVLSPDLQIVQSTLIRSQPKVRCEV